MKTFNQIIKETTTEINQLPRRTKAFVDKHVVQKMDYPVDVEDQFTAKKLKKDKTKLASFHDGEDASVYEEVDLDEQVVFKKMESGDHHIHHNGNPVGRIVKTNSMGSSGYSVRFGGNTSKHEVSDESSLSAAKQAAKWHLTSNESPLKKESVDLDEAYTLYHPSYTDAINTALNHHKDLTVSSDDRDTHIASGPRKPSEGNTVSHNIPATDKSGNAHMIHIQVYNKGGSKPFELNTYSSKVPKKRMKEEASMSPTDMKQREAIVKGMKKNTQDFKDRYGSKWKSVMYATATKAAMKESVEQINEISVKKLDKYLAANDKDREDLSMNKIGWIKGSPTADQQKNLDKLNKRVKGDQLAGTKMYPTAYKNTPYAAKVPATESVDLDEAFKAGAMKLNDGSSVTLTNESSNALNNLFNQLSSSNKTKMEQRLMSGSKGFNEILAFAKEV